MAESTVNFTYLASFACVGVIAVLLITIFGGAAVDALMPLFMAMLVGGCIGAVAFVFIGAFLEYYRILTQVTLFNQLHVTSMWHIALAGAVLGMLIGLAFGIYFAIDDRPMN